MDLLLQRPRWRSGALACAFWGGKPQQLTSGGGNDARPGYEGRFLYFQRDGDAWRRPLDQDITDPSRDELVLRGCGDKWAVGRRNLYAILRHERRIVAVDLETKAVRELLRFPDDWDNPGGGPQVSVGPDEQFLAFGMFEYGKSDLILVENLE